MSEAVAEATVPMDRLAKTYRRIRDKKSEITAAYDAQIADLDSQLEVLAEAMREHMKANNLTSMKTTEGTVILSKTTRFDVQDWDAFKSFVVEHDALDLLERRVAQSKMAEFIEANPDVAVPSLRSNAKFSISVRKPAK